ncbi:MAG TPA: DUF4157 domain-containing protein, partial [Kofleriaceae bacterium]|nr:DUF4157 domain-containing protein [Kofleriaceae bacterium]
PAGKDPTPPAGKDPTPPAGKDPTPPAGKDPRPPAGKGPDPTELGPIMANKGEELINTPRPQALRELLDEARAANVEIHTDAEAQRFLDWAARAAGAEPETYHAVTLGDDIFVRPEYADNVRVLREELIHVFQQRAGASTAEIVEKEIEARLLMIRYRQKWAITNDEVREMIREVRIMRRTGKY